MWLSPVIGCLLIINKISTTTTSQNSPSYSIPYQFGYTVNVEETGDYKTHREASDGKVVQGEYSLSEPNGDLRTVSYVADRTNGFRASVQVQPGARKLSRQRGDEQTLHSKPNPNTSNSSEKSTQSLPTTDQVQENITISLYKTTSDDNKSNDFKYNIKINNETTNSAVKTANSSLFEILPGLDKHVPKIEYIFEEDYGDNDGLPDYLKNADIISSNKPQVIPAKIQEDVENKNLELVKSDSAEKLNFATAVGKSDNTSSKKDLQQYLKQATGSTFTTKSDQVITSTDLQNNMYTSNLESSTKTSLTSEQTESHLPQKVVVFKEDNQNIVNQKNLELTVKGSTSESSILKFKNTEQNPSLNDYKRGNKPIDLTIDETKIYGKILDKNVAPKQLTKEGETDDKMKAQETQQPKNKFILTTLMVPTAPIIKFTCLPDATNESGLKISPIGLNVSSTTQKFPQNVVRASSQNPVGNIQTMNTKKEQVIPYLTSSVSFPPLTTTDPLNTFMSTLYPSSLPFTSQAGVYRFSEPQQVLFQNPMTNNPYNLHFLGSSKKVDQQKPTLASLNMELTQPTKAYTSSRNEGSKLHQVLKSVQNRPSPLYPIPYPWIYHPVRPHGYHPRHLPVFVLPMSHNAHYARIFDPESIDQHNN